MADTNTAKPKDRRKRKFSPGVAFAVTNYQLFDWTAQHIQLSEKLRSLRNREAWLTRRIKAAALLETGHD